jgi:hypothetical protein
VVNLSDGIFSLASNRERKQLGWALIIEGTISEFQLIELNIAESRATCRKPVHPAYCSPIREATLHHCFPLTYCSTSYKPRSISQDPSLTCKVMGSPLFNIKSL